MAVFGGLYSACALLGVVGMVLQEFSSIDEKA